MHIVDGWGNVKYCGRDRLVVSVGGKIYQAGENLEENVSELKHLFKIKIEKCRKAIIQPISIIMLSFLYIYVFIL